MSKLIIESDYIFNLIMKAKEIQADTKFESDREYIQAKTIEDLLLDILQESSKYNCK